ncbi:WecB/TagA/CpsF family glycosyltransferase [Arthrobacter sp. HLT1-20]
MNRRNVLSVRQGKPFLIDRPVLQGNMEKALDRISILAMDDQAHLVVTANIDHVIDLHDGFPLTPAYEHASLRVIDGMPVVWALRALGAKNLHRVTGADLIESVSAVSADRKWRVAITGGDDRVLGLATRNLRRRYPEALIEAVSMPMLSSAKDPKGSHAVGILHDYKPDVVFLCLGAPKQESWFLHWRDTLPAAVYIGAGAAVDFAAETKKRAPILAQRAGLEWLWRLSQEFGRLAPRYLVKGPRFVNIAMRSAFLHTAYLIRVGR